MNPETINMLLSATAVISVVSTPVLVFLLHQSYRALAKVTNIQVNDTVLKHLESLAFTAVQYAQEQANKYLKSLQRGDTAATGPKTGEEKKEVAIAAMKSMAPAGMKFTDEQAAIAIEAAVQQQRGHTLPPAAVDPAAEVNPLAGSTYQSMNPGSLLAAPVPVEYMK